MNLEKERWELDVHIARIAEWWDDLDRCANCGRLNPNDILPSWVYKDADVCDCTEAELAELNAQDQRDEAVNRALALRKEDGYAG